MTLPSSEELQRLLDQWDDSDDAPANRKVRHLAPVLAAEVIRLRKAIKELRNHYIELMEISDKANIVDSLMMGHALSVVDELNTVLEGDQA